VNGNVISLFIKMEGEQDIYVELDVGNLLNNIVQLKTSFKKELSEVS